jgi:hypothetical protein
MTDLTVSLALLGEPRNLTAEALEMSTSPVTGRALRRLRIELTFFNCGSYWRGVRSSLGLARKPSRRPGRYCIRRSRVLTSTVS